MSSFQILYLNSNSVDSVASLLVAYNGRKILFNCGEGTQRYGVEHRQKLTKLDAIFISKLDWNHVGGLPGLLLTLSDSGMSKCELVGPPGLRHYIACMSSFLMRKGFNLAITECSEKSNLRRFTFTSGVSVDVCYCGDAVDFSKSEDCTEFLHRMFAKSASVEPHVYPGPSIAEIRVSDSFFKSGQLVFGVWSPSIAGKLDMDAVKALNVPAGPLLSRLKDGKSVDLEDGRKIYPHQCVGPPLPSFGTLVAFDECLLQDRELMSAFSASKFKICLVSKSQNINESDDSVLLASNDNFAERIIYLENCTSRISFSSTAYLQQRMAKEVCKEAFSNLHCTFNDIGTVAEERCNFLAARSSLVFDQAGNFTVEKWDHVLDKLICTANEKKEPIPVHDFICFLGTGSALPSKYRNVSSFLVGFPSQKCFYLFDCGEGTYGQLFRKYGDYAKIILENLKAIFISHLHADHHLGVVKFLQSRSSACDPVAIITPICLKKWFENQKLFYQNCSKFFVISIDEAGACCGPKSFSNVVAFEAIPVIHCWESFGFLVEFRNEHNRSFRLAYSGDTRPCNEFCEKVFGVDILVHEATFDDSMAKEAIQRNHCTVSEAIEICSRSQCAYAILTHFSQRYPKFPELQHDSNVLVACDGMQLFINEMHKYKSLFSKMKQFFDNLLTEDAD